MSIFMVFMISYDRDITNYEYHQIVKAAARVDCFVRFIARSPGDERTSLIENFCETIDYDQEVVFTLSSNPYDETSHYLYEREMLDPDGCIDDSSFPKLAKVLEMFLSDIKEAKRFLLVCSEGYDTRNNFNVVEVAPSDIAENLIAIYVGSPPYFPSIALRGSWS